METTDTRETTAIINGQSARWGLYLGVINVIFYYVCYFIAPMAFYTNQAIQWILTLFHIGILIYFLLQVKKAAGAHWTFKEAFSSAFIIQLISGAIFSVGAFILLNLVDHSLHTQITDFAVAKIQQSKGLTQEQLDAAEKMVRKFDPAAPMSILLTFFINIAGAALVALLLALIFKKDRTVPAV